MYVRCRHPPRRVPKSLLKGSEELFAPHRTRNAPQPGFHRTPAFLSLWKVNNTLYIADKWHLEGKAFM
jgi:hypothetical protein